MLSGEVDPFLSLDRSRARSSNLRAAGGKPFQDEVLWEIASRAMGPDSTGDPFKDEVL